MPSASVSRKAQSLPEAHRISSSLFLLPRVTHATVKASEVDLADEQPDAPALCAAILAASLSTELCGTSMPPRFHKRTTTQRPRRQTHGTTRLLMKCERRCSSELFAGRVHEFAVDSSGTGISRIIRRFRVNTGCPPSHRIFCPTGLQGLRGSAVLCFEMSLGCCTSARLVQLCGGPRWTWGHLAHVYGNSYRAGALNGGAGNV